MDGDNESRKLTLGLHEVPLTSPKSVLYQLPPSASFSSPLLHLTAPTSLQIRPNHSCISTFTGVAIRNHAGHKLILFITYKVSIETRVRYRARPLVSYAAEYSYLAKPQRKLIACECWSSSTFTVHHQLLLYCRFAFLQQPNRCLRTRSRLTQFYWWFISEERCEG